METRIEKDTYGEVEIQVGKLWGPNTQRSLENNPQGNEKMPFELIQAYALLKRAVAQVNYDNHDLSREKYEAIKEVSEAIENGDLREHFPLTIWQSGSGEDSHVNINEVMANYINNKYNDKIIDPEKDVNKNQHTNDSFPTAMFIASYNIIRKLVIPEIENWIETLSQLEIKVGDKKQRAITHFQPRNFIKISDVLSGWREALVIDKERLNRASVDFRYVVIGGGEVGSGENLPGNFSDDVSGKIADYTGEKFDSEKNKYLGLSIRGEYAFAQGALQSLTATLTKIASDMQLGYSPFFDKNKEKINRSSIDAIQKYLEILQMAAIKISGSGTAVQTAISQGHFQTNAHLPIVIYNFIESSKLITAAMKEVRKNVL